MFPAPLRSLRESAGLTQAELAAQAGVSRQLVGAVEKGRHLPRVDAALALARALGVDVEALFGVDSAPVDAVTGQTPADGTLVRAGRVGDRAVTAPVRIGSEGWGVADGVIERGRLTVFEPRGPGLVVVGCEPGLEVLERLLREEGMAAVAAVGSSAAAAEALVDGRVHAAVVHGPPGALGLGAKSVERFRLARWRVGLAAPSTARPGWWGEALSGRVAVIQREPGAQAQRAFDEAVTGEVDDVPGPRVRSHLEAARRSVIAGLPAVTIEPAALAVGARFHPLETHEVEVWIAREWRTDRSVSEAMNVVSSTRFQRRLGAVGGYDLSSCGARAA